MTVDLGQASSLGELLEAARTAEANLGRRQLWYRGHSKSEWKLVPTAHRRHPILESTMANLFRLRAPAVWRDCPLHTDYIRWLPLMRHYGLPTRLLDWTESIAVAAFFATKFSNSDESSIIWMLSPGDLNSHSIGQLVPFMTDDRVRSIAEAAFSGKSYGAHSVAVIAPRENQRMAVQLGNFTVHGSRDPLEDHPKAAEFLARIELPPGAHNRIVSDLLSIGITLSNLFPDLEHLAEEIAGLMALGPNGEDLEC